MWNVYVHEVGGNGQFKISLVTGSWNTSTVTYNSRPSLSSEISIDVSLHTGWNSVDVTRLFSAWFNAADQKQNYGIAVTSGSAWARICSSDVLPRNERMNFSATYVTGIGTPTLTATPPWLWNQQRKRLGRPELEQGERGKRVYHRHLQRTKV